MILVSRNGFKTGYQALRIRFWKKTLSTLVISKEDVTQREGCMKLLGEANKLGPVDAIFNLAVVLKDDLFENQTIDNFMSSLNPKAMVTKYLDETSRIFCPKLRLFVVFSSVSCGRGNTGQTNYGMANSVMERICEQRQKDGLPGLAVQWGAVGDVGLVADANEINKELVIGGTLQQKVPSCLEVLDKFLNQTSPIVSSMVVAEKRAGGNIEEVICNILGVKDMKMINLQLTFSELGMDSITGVEIKQMIETEFEIVLTTQDVKNMSFIRLRELAKKKDLPLFASNDSQIKIQNEWLNLLVKNLKDTGLSDIPVLQLPCLSKNTGPDVFFLPGVEGMCTILEPLTSNLNCCAIGLQFLSTHPNDNANSLAKILFPLIGGDTKTFTLISYSFGCLVALELVALAEKENRFGNLVFIDGAPNFFKKLVYKKLNVENEEYFKTSLLLEIVSSNASADVVSNLKENIAPCETFDEKLNLILEILREQKHFSADFLRTSINVVYERVKGITSYTPSFGKLKSKVKLLRPRHSPEDDISEDYGLSELFETPVEVKFFDADHASILHNKDVAVEINEVIQHSSMRNFHDNDFN